MNKARAIKLFCPSLSKLIQFQAWDEQRLDLGSISLAFGLDPSTVRLNGHFISRGVDLVSSSVTWRSLLNFFSAKGLSTGINDEDAIIVDGRLCKVGSKRSHNSEDALVMSPDKIAVHDFSVCQRQSSEVTNLIRSKKLRGNSTDGDHLLSRSNGLGLKRKHSPEDLGLLKKLRINESSSECPGAESKHCSTIDFAWSRKNFLTHKT